MVASLPRRVLDLAFPARCPGCGREGAPICDACLPALDARLHRPAGVPIGLPSDIPPPILQLEWCAPFSGVVRRALHELKYAGETRLAVPLGAAIARRWARVGAGGDVLVPVPVHAERRRRRGYDQAELIARFAAAELGLPCAPILERARATVAQFDLDRATRATNVHGAFALRPRPGEGDRPAGEGEPGVGEGHRRSGGGEGHGRPGGRDRGPHAAPDPVRERPLAGRWMVLVDDVVTTGATLAACAEPLLRAGAVGVSAITVARER
jgi:predicted amidophosphoribosyltransferase